MLHFQISRSSVEIVGSASSVWISLAVLHQAPLLGHCTAQETPCVEAWPVVSGQWSRRMLSPWTLEDAQRPGEAGVGVRGKRGGHGGEEKDGETVRVVAGGWKGWAGLCRMRGYRSKYCWRVAAARRRRRHWPPAETAAARRCTLYSCNMCAGPHYSPPQPATSIRTRRAGAVVCRISAARSTAGGCSFLVSAWPVSALSAEHILLLLRQRICETVTKTM